MERVDPELALGVMWETARSAWLISGRAMPDYTREKMPGRIVRPPECDARDD